MSLSCDRRRHLVTILDHVARGTRQIGALFAGYLADVRLGSDLVVGFLINTSLFSTTTATTPTMFKSILPSRKLPDGDFLMVTSPLDGAKENYPALTATTNMTTKFKPDKVKKSKSRDSPVQPVATEQAFDQLLVRGRVLHPTSTLLTWRPRTNSRSRPRYGRNSLVWSRL